MDTSQLKAMRRFRKGMRFVGVWFFLIGGLLFYSMLTTLLDPEGVIIYNGVPTTDYSVKLGATLFAGIFVVVGLFLSFSTQKMLNKLFVFKLTILSAIGFKK
ncbi:MAG: hypothetical protein HRT35_29465 [Algicola sp.]|nr:hypothetical protein [Algicola sp.]